MRLRYVLWSVYGLGGTIRSVVNQANALCGEHDVEIASVYRHLAEPPFASPASQDHQPMDHDSPPATDLLFQRDAYLRSFEASRPVCAPDRL